MKPPLHRHPTSRRHAFTLVEMLLVLVILATLAAIVIPKMAGRGEQAKRAAAQTDIKGMETAIEMFEVDNGYFPKSGDLTALRTAPANAKDWKGPYLNKDIPADPWGNAYTYDYPGKRNPGGFDLMSAGTDGQFGTDDDVSNFGDVKK